MSYSTNSFYRFKELYETAVSLPSRRPNLKNRADEQIENAVAAFALEKLPHGLLRVSNEPKKQTISVSGATVRNSWTHQDLEAFEKGLKALEAKVA
jgi:hypothetical protein